MCERARQTKRPAAWMSVAQATVDDARRLGILRQQFAQVYGVDPLTLFGLRPECVFPFDGARHLTNAQWRGMRQRWRQMVNATFPQARGLIGIEGDSFGYLGTPERPARAR